MVNDKPDDDLTPEQQWALKSLVREAARSKAKPFVRPDSDTIIAYVSGNASERQMRDVQEAMVASEDFRREMVEAVRESDTHTDPGPENVDASPQIPPFEEFYKKNAALIEGKPPVVISKQSTASNIVRVVLPWAVAATMTLVVAWQSLFREPVPPSFIPIAASLPAGIPDPGLFSGTSPRSGDNLSSETPLFATAYEAAIEALAGKVMFSNRAYELKPNVVTDSEIQSGRSVQILFVSSSRDIVGQDELIIPVSLSPKDSLELWYMTLPSGHIFSSAIDFDTLAFPWANSEDNRAVGVVTWRSRQGFVHAQGSLLSVTLKASK